jgi:tetratricopeptide (TPR) repeat protein
MKEKLFILLLLIPLFLCSQTEKESEYNTVSGFISYKNNWLSNVTVFVEGAMRYTVTDSTGFYSINVKPLESISFSYVGLKKVCVLIEEITSVLNINMTIENTIEELRLNKTLKLGDGTIGDYPSAYMIRRIEGDSLNKNATSLTKAIQDKIPDLRLRINEFAEEVLYIRGQELEGPAIWIFDGVSFDIPIPVYISEVKEVFVINSKETGFVIRVITNIDYSKVKDIDYNNYYFTDAEYYANNAIKYKKVNTKIPTYLDEYRKRANSNKALSIYLNQYSKYKSDPNYHFELLNYFNREKYSKNIMLKVLSDFENFAANNPEDLKGIAYKYQELDEHEKALSVYKKIIELRPNYLQSYRDLANTFLILKEYRNLWFAYNYFLDKGYKIEDNDIGEIMTSEIIAAYNLDKEDQASRRKIKINNPYKNIESDVRIVFEWNTSEAEFILEFVNPNLQTYTAENSSNNNNDLIIDQKKKGYTSKEIFIEDLKEGTWLVNLTYLGNKQYSPTIFKVTTYYNWGRPNQLEKIDVFDFSLQNIKMELLKLNRRSL